MRHQKAHRKLGRTTAHRISLLRSLATSLINARDERIVTTLPKAKELRPYVEKVITLSKKTQGLEGPDAGARAVHLRRQAASFFHSGNTQQVAITGKRGAVRPPRTAGVAAVKRLFDDLGERYKDRPGGYTRILKLGRRDGDNAELAIIELVGNAREVEAEAAKQKKTAGSTKKSAKPSKAAASSGSKSGGKKKASEDSTDVKPKASRKKADASVDDQEDK
jgi:large subunit ribosomal protein L17